MFAYLTYSLNKDWIGCVFDVCVCMPMCKLLDIWTGAFVDDVSLFFGCYIENASAYGRAI